MSNLREHLDRLDAALAAATPGPWGKAWSNHLVDGDVHPDDAALIVAAVNNLPRLLAAVRAAADLADRWEHGAKRWEHSLPVPPEVAQLRTALATALTDGDAR